ADVYRASHFDRDGSHFALKRLQTKWSFDPQLRAMFASEARLATTLRHPNLVRVYDTGEHMGLPYMVMEYVKGASCAKLLREVARDGGGFERGAALMICAEVLRGLSYVHSARDASGNPLGIVHRDVSPGNILISEKGEIKLTDFGIARSTEIDHHTDPGQVKGKFGYMSPEQVSGDEELDARSDLFSLGVVLAEMLLGRRLFSGKGEFEVLTRMYEADLAVLDEEASRLDAALVVLLKKALQRDREARFQTAGEFLAAIYRVAAELGLELESSLTAWLREQNVMPATSGTYSFSFGQAQQSPQSQQRKPFKR
ncbi:MAG TPA: serine/threonine-protein kinase, partial [Polyangiaceae bacterium]|nr:serine/threonine-protein kinase [Polyangiaceae bacterium]